MGMNSIVGRSALIQKVYFRREILIISTNITTLIMFCFEMGIFFIFLAIVGLVPPLTIIFFPLIVVNLFVLTVGVSLALSSLNVYFRDIQHIWVVVLQAGFFLTPIFYKFDILPESLISILKINPLVGILELSRAVIIHEAFPTAETIIQTVVTTVIIFFIGYIIFRKLDYRLMDRL